MRTFSRVRAVSHMTLRFPNAFLISRLFAGTTEETIMLFASRSLRIRRISEAFSCAVGMRCTAINFRRDDNAIFVNELLTSMSRKSIARGALLRLGNLARSLALCSFIVLAVYAAAPPFAISFARQISAGTISSSHFS